MTQTSAFYSECTGQAVCSTILHLRLCQRPRELLETSSSSNAVLLGPQEQQNSSAGFFCTQQEQKAAFQQNDRNKILEACRSRSHKNSHMGQTQGSFSPGPSVSNSGHEQIPREDQEQGKHNTMLPMSILS